MLKKGLVLFCVLVPLAAASLNVEWRSAPPDEKRTSATGVVYHDANNNRRYDRGDKPLPNVRVSNGREIVKTDDQGRYELPIDDESILFVIQPSGWRTPLSKEMLPEFYYIHKPKGSPPLKYKGVEPTGPLPDSVDFPLYPQRQPKEFKVLLFGDPQPRNQQEIDYIAQDVIPELIGTDASFGVTLGDIMFDDLSLFQPLNRTFALLGIPWYNVIGNHDINFDAKRREDANETFESVYGPSYYSFNYSTAHFLVLDDIDWHAVEEKVKVPEKKVDEKKKDAKPDPKKDDEKPKYTTRKRWRYRGGLGEKQMEFIRNDLAMIPENQLVVLLMHIPLVDVHDRHELYRLIEKRPFCISISGHTHYHQHEFITKNDGWRGPKPHHHIINVTVSGSWWSGAPNERGIPHTMMRDGAPNGYSIITFNGTEYKLDFKAAGKPADYQMYIHAPNAVPVDEAAETDVFVNVFNGSERSTVEMRLGDEGPWTKMERKTAVDPSYAESMKREREWLQEFKKKPFRSLPGPHRTPHLWRAKLPCCTPAGVYKLHVRTTDMHGRMYHAYRVIRLTEAKLEKTR